MNFGQLVDEVLLSVAGYTQRQDQATYLMEDISETATQFTVKDGKMLSRGLAELDDELVWIDTFDQVTGIATIAPMGRGFRGTTAAPHTAGSRVAISPAYPRAIVKKRINDAITGVYPDLFGVYYSTFPFVAARNTYQLPTEAIEPLSVSWQTIGPSREWLPVRRWRPDKMANVGVFNTGKTISIYDGIVPGRTVQVVYSKRPTELVLPADDFTDSGLPDSAREVIVLGAAYRLTGYLDSPRVTGMSVEADALDQSNPSGAGAQVSRYLFAQYKDRLNVEMKRQYEMFPTRVHYSR